MIAVTHSPSVGNCSEHRARRFYTICSQRRNHSCFSFV